MKLNKDKLKSTYGYLEGSMDAVDLESATRAMDYKKQVIKNYITISPGDIDTRMGGEEFYATRKYDGELNVIFYDNGVCVVINRNGRVKSGIPCIDEAAKLLEAAGIKEAIIPAEMYVDESADRTRIFDVLKAYADEKLTNTLRLAPFDILEIDRKLPQAVSYGDIHAQLMNIFKDGVCQPVRCQKASSKNEIKDIYTKWVEEEGAEGLVIRTESPLVYKVKPRYTVDVAVVGFSEGIGDAKGAVRSLLIAMMSEEGKYQIVGRTGNGMTEEMKVEFLEKLSPTVLPSKYIETDSNHVAFRMIKPEMVIELTINDVLFESSSGPALNTIVEIKDGEYIRSGDCEGVSFVYPIFTRIRDDKSVNPVDVRLDQINAITALPEKKSSLSTRIATSTILHREVYKKESGGKIMVRKFLIWRTNKENIPEFPAYVLHFTDYSSERKELLQRDLRVSNDKEQIEGFLKEMIAENIKKGWVQV